MKVKLLHHSHEWLEGDFEAPQALAKKSHITAWRKHVDSSSGSIAMKLGAGTAAWDASGKLLSYIAAGADLDWFPEFPESLSLENKFGLCQHQKGIRHILKRVEVTSGNAISEMEVCVKYGEVRYLILNHKKEKCLVTYLDQNVWGYVMVDVQTMTQLPIELHWRSATLSPPAFSPDDSVIVSCNYYRKGWWTDDLDAYTESASEGGLRKVGVISVHDIASGQISAHDVMVTLPAGWIPDRPDEPDWDMLWGPEFISENQFKIWLPDESVEILQLPLPPRIEISKEIGTQRNWESSF